MQKESSRGIEPEGKTVAFHSAEGRSHKIPVIGRDRLAQYHRVSYRRAKPWTLKEGCWGCSRPKLGRVSE